MTVLNRRSPYRNWRLDQSFGREFTINRDTWQYDGLVGLWTCFGQNRGVVALRDEINHRNMTAFNTPAISTSLFGSVTLFDDANTEYLETDIAVAPAVPLTMSTWFNSNTIGLNQTLMFLGDKDGHNDYQALKAAGGVGGDPIEARTHRGPSGVASSTAGYTLDTWHLATGVWSGIDARAAFLDGANKGTDATNLNLVLEDRVSIGRLGDASPSDYLSGMIAEARIYNRALSDAEVFALWEPSTRWDLYKPTKRAFFMFVPSAVGLAQPIIPLHGIHSVIGGGQIVR